MGPNQQETTVIAILRHPAGNRRVQRQRLISYSAMEAATEAFRLSTSLVIGIETRWSQCSRTRRESPSPYEPITTTNGPSTPGMPDTSTSPSPASPMMVKPALE